MQAAAFPSPLGAAHYEICSQHEVAQFNQVIRDAEVGVVLVNFPLQQADAVSGSLKALGGSHDADVVPHEAAQFVPVVRDDDFLVGIRDAAFVPLRQNRQWTSFRLENVLCGRGGKDKAFEQGIARQPVGPMQTGESSFPHGIEARQSSSGGKVGDDAAAGIVRRRYDRDRLAGNIDA